MQTAFGHQPLLGPEGDDLVQAIGYADMRVKWCRNLRLAAIEPEEIRFLSKELGSHSKAIAKSTARRLPPDRYRFPR